MNSGAMPFIKKMNKIIITLFGATGNLATKKLLPALTNLIRNQDFNGDLTILALGRRNYTQEEYLRFIQKENNNGDLHLLKKHLVYVKMDISNIEDYQILKNAIYNESDPSQLRKIFYLAVGPDLFIPISEGLSKFKLIRKNDVKSIIAFEKPFGGDFKEANQINNYLCSKFSEKQIYRVDHYLGKEMIQNLLALRFSNVTLESIWNNKYIDQVNIVVKEKENILTRGSYYDKAGILKDMVQSHLLQMLTLTAINPPKSLFSDDVKNEKIKVLKKIKVIHKDTLLGQYNGYLNEPGVKKDSQTPSLAFLHLQVNTHRFKGVPFYLFSGKKLAKKEAYIELIFKKSKHLNLFHENIIPNRLKLVFAPESEISISMNAKKVGFGTNLEKIELKHCYSCEIPGNIKEAYEKLFLEMINSHKTLFTRWDEILLSWEIINEIQSQMPPLVQYGEDFEVFQPEESYEKI